VELVDERGVGVTRADLASWVRVGVTRLAVGRVCAASTRLAALLVLPSSRFVTSPRLMGSVRAGCCGNPRLLEVAVLLVTGLDLVVLLVTGLVVRRAAVFTVRVVGLVRRAAVFTVRLVGLVRLASVSTARVVGLVRRAVAAVGLTRLEVAATLRLVGVTPPVIRRATLLVLTRPAA
jgi:hypothetical protein